MIAVSKPFVILLHTGGGAAHHDLMLQRGGALATWRLPAGPPGPGELAAGEHVPAVALNDHRLAYLTHEGAVSGGRGCVRRVDEGQWEALDCGPERWEFTLAGRLCRGRYELRLAAGGEAEWTFTCLARTPARVEGRAPSRPSSGRPP